MQREEVRQLVMAILSGYLAYIGIGVIRDYDAGKSAAYIVAAVLFILFGGASCVWYLRRFVLLRRDRTHQGHKEDQEQAGVQEDRES